MLLFKNLKTLFIIQINVQSYYSALMQHHFLNEIQGLFNHKIWRSNDIIPHLHQRILVKKREEN